MTTYDYDTYLSEAKLKWREQGSLGSVQTFVQLRCPEKKS